MTYTIQETAKLVGLSTSTLRRWERLGRLRFTPDRDPAGRRIYSPGEVAQLRKLAQRLHPVGRLP